jgi:4-amino-4-deoxy-L-arabinose transferase-like glycosyltransferase
MKDKKIIIVLLVALLIRIVYLFKFHSIWWDSAVYLGMGKYIFSAGQLGIWEIVRPPVWPLILGFIWKLGLNPIIVGRIIEICFSMGCIFLVFLLGRKWFGREAGLIAATILAFTPVFFSFSFRLYTEIPSTFLALFAVYLYSKKKIVHSGLLSGLAFLTRFPQGIVFAVLALFSLERLKKAVRFVLGFALIALPFFIFCYIRYGSFTYVFIEASGIVKAAGIWIFAKPWYFYLLEFLWENLLYAFAAIGVLCMRKKHLQPLLLFVLFFLYFSNHPHKEPRFMIVFLPYAALFAGYGIKKIFRRTKVFWVVLVIAVALLFIGLKPDVDEWTRGKNYYTFLEGKNVTGEVLTTHPLVSWYSPVAVKPIYFPVFNSELAQEWNNYIKANASKIDYIFMDTCEGGMLCPPDDTSCPQKQAMLLQTVKKDFSTGLYEKKGRCEYYVFQGKLKHQKS